MLTGRALSPADEEGVEAASTAGTNKRRCEKTTGTGGRVASNEGTLRAGSADTLDGSAISGDCDCSVRAEAPVLWGSGMNTCALATLAVASSPRARSPNFIWETFESRRLNGRIIRQYQRRRRRVVAELVKSDGEAPIADVLSAAGCAGRDDGLARQECNLSASHRVDTMAASLLAPGVTAGVECHPAVSLIAPVF
jgi:hypothetical protein